MTSPEHVSGPVGSIETLQHRQRTADLHLVDEQRLLGVGSAAGLQAALEIVRETLEAEVQPLDGALLDVQDVVDRDPVRPRLQPALEAELRQVGDDADQDFLGRVLGVLAIPEHPQRQAVDVPLEGPHERVQRLAVAVECLPRDVFNRGWRCHRHCQLASVSPWRVREPLVGQLTLTTIFPTASLRSMSSCARPISSNRKTRAIAGRSWCAARCGRSRRCGPASG